MRRLRETFVNTIRPPVLAISRRLRRGCSISTASSRVAGSRLSRKRMRLRMCSNARAMVPQTQPSIELAILTRMLRLAYETSKLMRIPVIRKLKEKAPRQGFFEREQFEAVRRRLRPDLQAAVAIAHAYGWRMQSEVLALERRQVDLDSGTLRLDPGAPKNDEGRVVYLTPELKALLAAQLERVEELSKRTRQIVPHLFPHLTGRRAGTRRGDFRKAWTTACQKAGVPGMLRHDLRRTAVRNMVNLGVPERVAMKVTGHKTRSVFDRYHIVSPGDLQDVARRLAGTFSGTPHHSEVAPRRLSSDNPSTRP